DAAEVQDLDVGQRAGLRVHGYFSSRRPSVASSWRMAAWSCCTKAVVCAGERLICSAPWLASTFCHSASPLTSAKALRRISMICGGVPLGAASVYQVAVAVLPYPASASVGTLGSSGVRCAPP